MNNISKVGIAAALAAATVAMAGSAGASSLVVDAYSNSSSGGAGVFAANVTTGETLHVTVNPGDLWNAGALPRWSNADGLTHNTYATGSDDSGQPAGTQIGQNFGLYSQGNLSAPYGTLVGNIGGVWAALGTSFNGPAWGTGALKLYYWDSNYGDNTQFITANFSAGVPEPAAWALMLTGFGLIGLTLRGRRQALAA